jgi:hypothetical protein
LGWRGGGGGILSSKSGITVFLKFASINEQTVKNANYAVCSFFDGKSVFQIGVNGKIWRIYRLVRFATAIHHFKSELRCTFRFKLRRFFVSVGEKGSLMHFEVIIQQLKARRAALCVTREMLAD